MVLTGNKGEWSELYVFTKLLAEGKLYNADKDLNKKTSFVEVVKVFREQSGTEYIYSVEDDNIVINKSGKEVSRIQVLSFKENAKNLLKGILKGSGKAFGVESVDSFLEEVYVTRLKAISTQKGDIKIRIHDQRIGGVDDLSYSIKSLMGKDSTLFNTSPGNNFIYEVTTREKLNVQSFNKQTYSKGKITERLTLLSEKGSIKFSKIQSTQLQKNIRMIDGDLLEIMANALIYKYMFKKSKVKDVVEKLETLDPLGFYQDGRGLQRFYENKVTHFLMDCALGMTPETEWNVRYDANGGVIIAKKDGDVLCFHMYDINVLREYLYNNTKFEQASTGEDANNPGTERIANKEDKSKPKKYYFGWLYTEGDKNLIKLNLQIRFTAPSVKKVSKKKIASKRKA